MNEIVGDVPNGCEATEKESPPPQLKVHKPLQQSMHVKGDYVIHCMHIWHGKGTSASGCPHTACIHGKGLSAHTAEAT